MRVYLAGPMRGYPDWNVGAFNTARCHWIADGHHVFCPAAVVKALGYAVGGDAEPSSHREHLRHVIQSDITCILHAEAVAVLPGWEESRGATVEVALAQFLGLPIHDATTMLEINPILKPWAQLKRRPALPNR